MPSAPEIVRSFRFSTAELPRRARGDAVRALRERGVLPMEPLPDRPVHVQIVKWFLPGASLISGTLCGLRQDGAHAGSDGDELLFGLNLAGRGRFVQRGREITPADGDAVLVNPAAGAFAMIRPTPARCIGLRVPRKVIAPLVVDLDDLAMRLIPSATDGLKLLTGYLRAILDSQVLASPERSRLVVTHLHDLIALSIGGTREGAVEGGSVRAARLAAIKSDIVANLEDGALTVAAVAARHGVTPRYVHKLFEGEGFTCTQFVLRQRLDHAYRMLRDSRLAARSISAIAYDVGFGDLSYFNRAFRRQYNATPSDIRNHEGTSSGGSIR